MVMFRSKSHGLFVITTIMLVAVSAQRGFLSIDCGGMKNHTESETNMTWTVDTNYIDVGMVANVSIGNPNISDELKSLRFFPMPLNKSCYRLPLKSNVPHLVRLTFVLGNYNGIKKLRSFNFSLETQGMLYQGTESISDRRNTTQFREYIITSSSDVLYVCLIRTTDDCDPFISAIEVRRLLSGMYNQQAEPGILLNAIVRYDLAAEAEDTIRYPRDLFDRMWTSDISWPIYKNKTHPARIRSSKRMDFNQNSSVNLPPAVVMQTAVVEKWLGYSLDIQNTKTLIMLYFAEIGTLNVSEVRQFDIVLNEQKITTVNLSRQNYSFELPILFNDTEAPHVQIALRKPDAQRKTGRNPLLNALEYYRIYNSEPLTFVKDVQALLSIKGAFDIKNWISDPCFGIEWRGIKCNQSHPVRVTELDLAGRSLSGSIPPDISNLTGLTSISLQNNHLSGFVPDLCTMTKLQIIRLQNNNLSGTIPNCLSRFQYLQELNIENNNFRGVIPKGLLNKGINLRYSGNLLLCNGKLRCYSKERNNKIALKSLVGVAFAVVLVAILAYAYHRRHRKAHHRLSVKVPNPETCRKFSVLEIKTAKRNFTQKIGQGGFGSVYFGKLQNGRDVAVKILSSFSKQGVTEFLNEIYLLSRVNHKNLLSLLGYCDDAQEPMLVYEHMCGGSLNEHLYGSLANCGKLDWKTRLRVALDAAEGLEYLHGSCTPKIIHRDIKSSNILLDSNMRAKVADFGLSRIVGDDRLSHVTTNVKGTIGYIDPEYFHTNQLTERSDIYSFGVVLLEIICGRKPIEPDLSEEERSIVKWVMLHLEGGDTSSCRLVDVIDKRLYMSEDDMKSFYSMISLTIKCIQSEASKRPSISEIVSHIRDATSFIQAEEVAEETIEPAYSGQYSSSILHVGR